MTRFRKPICFVCLAKLGGSNKSSVKKTQKSFKVLGSSYDRDYDHDDQDEPENSWRTPNQIPATFSHFSRKFLEIEENCTDKKIGKKRVPVLRCCDLCLPSLESLCETYENLVRLLDKISKQMEDASTIAGMKRETLEQVEVTRFQSRFIEKVKQLTTEKFPVIKLEPTDNFDCSDSEPSEIVNVAATVENDTFEAGFWTQDSPDNFGIESEAEADSEIENQQKQSTDSVSNLLQLQPEPDVSKVTICNSENAVMMELDLDLDLSRKKKRHRYVWFQVPSISDDELKRDWRVGTTNICKKWSVTQYHCAHFYNSCLAQVRRKIFPDGTVQCESIHIEHTNHGEFGKKSIKMEQPTSSSINTSQVKPAKLTRSELLRKCLMCGKMFRKRFQLEVHLRVHLEEKPFHCLMCPKEYSKRPSLKQHQLSSDHFGKGKDSKKLSAAVAGVCQICGKKFATKTLLTKHQLIHTEERNSECDVCHKKFKDREATMKHKSRVHSSGEKRYQCDDCGLKFKVSDSLRIHQRNHHGGEEAAALKNIKCPYEPCTMTYYTMSALKRHIVKHTGQKPFQCEICGSGFTQSHALKSHMDIHTGLNKVTRFLCKVCGKGFAYQNTLRKHEKSHFNQGPKRKTGPKPKPKGEKPGCKLCGKTFGTRAHLRRHEKGIGHLKRMENQRTETDVAPEFLLA